MTFFQKHHGKGKSVKQAFNTPQYGMIGQSRHLIKKTSKICNSNIDSGYFHLH